MYPSSFYLMITHTLYNGTVELVFDEDKHLYTVDGNPVPGVTSITDIKDKSNALIPWSLKLAGEYLISRWPVDGYISPETLAKLISEMKMAWRKKKHAAADIGTQTHEWIESYVKATMNWQPLPELPTDPQVRHAAQAFLDKFIDGHEIVFIALEKKVYSKKENYAGTLDIVAIVDGVLTLIDLKTSNAYREDYGMQTSAYVMAYNEEHGTNIENRIVLMLPKDSTSEVTPVKLPVETLATDYAGFLGAKALYLWNKNYKSLMKQYATRN